MKIRVPLSFLFLLWAAVSSAQFSEEQFVDFRNSVKDLNLEGLKSIYVNPTLEYYKGYNLTPKPEDIVYLDSVVNKLSLTRDEQQLLMQNHFFVTERLRARAFEGAYQTIFNKDLPVFVSTDLILHALHTSYDQILKSTEQSLMKFNLQKYIDDLYNRVPGMASKYKSELPDNVADVDLYLTVAQSLTTNQRLTTRYADQANYNEIMDAIEREQLTTVQLFTGKDRKRKIDFSQFKPRGHYVSDPYLPDTFRLEPYFRTMMWLGRIDFPLTPPPTGGMEPEWRFEEMQRMNISAFILNEMMQASPVKNLLEQNNEIITYLVGESDNLTSDEFTQYLQASAITDATQLKDSAAFVRYRDGLSLNPEFAQKYMGAFYYVDPCGDKPDVLPVSFMMSGQRFIIDSYVLANVVFDRITYKGEKVTRMMPNPLDALYALGNDDALYFLEDELQKYPYGSQLALMRYLIGQREPGFWSESLYNTWLSSIRALNPQGDDEKLPFFMRTGAWHQQKMNTQLAGWTQMRHDNLLYAKPSYTGGAGCSFPYSYVEPYPEFYKRLANYAVDAAAFFRNKAIEINFWMPVDYFFERFGAIMLKLETLAEKELRNESFTADEEKWLSQMLVKNNGGGGCGEPMYTGWIYSLFIDLEKFSDADYINVDIHTQPTDEYGTEVGKVLHTGLGEINLGVCLAQIPGTGKTAAFSGAFMSYYENITDNFLRLTDQEWSAKVERGAIPERPVWTRAYLADQSGTSLPVQKALPTSMLMANDELQENELRWADVYPNPVTAMLTIDLHSSASRSVNYEITEITGRTLVSGVLSSASKTIDLRTLRQGFYLIRLRDAQKQMVVKILKRE